MKLPEFPREVDDLDVVRAGLIERRNEAISAFAVEDMVLLSHAIAWLHWAQKVRKLFQEEPTTT